MQEEKRKYFIDGYYKQLLDDLKDAVHNHDTSIVLTFDGKSGKGKTTLSNQTGKELDPNFNLKNIYYSPEKFIKGLAEAKKGDYLSFDEAMIFSSRSAMSQVNKMIIQAMSMIRSKNIFVSFCVNSIFDLDRNLVLSRADVLLHVYGEGLVDRGRFVAFFKSKGDNRDRIKELYLLGKKFYNYSKPKGNFIARFPKYFVVNEKKYEAQKQIAINEFLTEGTDSYSKKNRRFDRLILLCVEKLNIPVSKLSDIIDMPESTLYDCAKRARKHQKTQRNYENELPNII